VSAARGDPPTGTVTFLFTDIEGSTRLLQQLGEDYRSLIDDHSRLLRPDEALDVAGGIRSLTRAFPK
jgi:class 3 adenylate cyclase